MAQMKHIIKDINASKMTSGRRSSFQYRTRAVFKTPYKSSHTYHHYSRDRTRARSSSPGKRSFEISQVQDREAPYNFEKSGSYHSSFDGSNDDEYTEKSRYYENGDKRRRVISTLNTLRNSWMSSSSRDSISRDDRYWDRDNDRGRNHRHRRSFTSISLNNDSMQSRPMKDQKKRDGNRKFRTMYYVSALLNVLMIGFIVYYMFFFQEKKTQNWNPYFEAPSTSPTISAYPTSMPSLNSTQSSITQYMLFDFHVTCPYDVNDLLGSVQNEIENITDSFQPVDIDVDILSAPECLSRRHKPLRLLEQLIVRIQIMMKSTTLSSEEMNDIFDQLKSSILESIPGSFQVRSEAPTSNDGIKAPSLSPLSISPSLNSQTLHSSKPSWVYTPSALPSEAPTALLSPMPSTVPTDVVTIASFEPSARPSIMPTDCDTSDDRRNLLRSLIQETSGIDYGSQNVLLSLEFTLDHDFYTNPCYDNSRILQRYFVASTYISWGLSRHLSYLKNECNYGGIHLVCNFEGEPTIINGEGSGLKGTIPRELMFLNSITELNLGWNQLNGTVPDNLRMLSSLEVFDIKNNAITGEFPMDLLQLKHLRKIDLGHLKLNGTVPEELGTLTRLEYLDFQHTTLTGTIPQSVLALPYLETIYIFGSTLTWN